MIRASRLASLIGVLLLQACEGGANGGDVAYDELPAAEIDAICDYMVHCGLAAGGSLCADAWGGVLHPDPNLDAAVENGSVKYDEDAAKACLETIRGGACSSGFIFQGDAPGSCDDIFKGTVADGGACWIDEQCVSKQCQTSGCADACCEGMCVAATPPAAIGEACGDGCVDGAFCDSNGVCAALKQSGEACGGFDECAGGLGCLAGTCQKGPAEGEPCVEFQCALPLACDPGTVTCEPLPGEGEACVPAANNCKIGLTCSASSMTCSKPGGVGSPCVPVFLGSGCAGDTYCAADQGATSGTCAALKADGAACGDDGECVSGDCSNAVCGAPTVCVQ